eukprot:jgi/Botrbrau1/21058/Bobra.0144s0057.1
MTFIPDKNKRRSQHKWGVKILLASRLGAAEMFIFTRDLAERRIDETVSFRSHRDLTGNVQGVGADLIISSTSTGCELCKDIFDSLSTSETREMAEKGARRLEVLSSHLIVVDPADQTTSLTPSETAAAAARVNFAKPAGGHPGILTAATYPTTPSFSELLQSAEQLLGEQHCRSGDRSGAPKVAVDGSSSWNPQVNVIDKGHSYAVDIAIPGTRAEDICVELMGSQLIISGKRINPAAYDTARVLIRELSNGPFQVVLNLPPTSDVSTVYAAYRDGLLRISFRKRSARSGRTA